MATEVEAGGAGGASDDQVERFDPVGALVRSWWLVLLSVVLGAAFLALTLGRVPPEYTSTATVLVSTGDSASTLTSGSGSDPDREINTQVEVLLGDAVVGRAAQDVEQSPADLRDAVQVEAESGSSVLFVSATAGDPAQAQEIASGLTEAYRAVDQEAGVLPLLAQADALAATAQLLDAQLDALPPATVDGPQDARRAAYAGEVASLVQEEARLRTAAESYGGRVTVLSAAQRPEEPSSLGTAESAALGAGLGLVVGVLLALARAWEPARRSRATHPTRQRLQSWAQQER